MNRRAFVLAGAASTALTEGFAVAASSNLRAGCQTNAWRINPQNFAELLAVLDKIRAYGYHGFETGFRNVQGQFENLPQARAAIEKRGLQFFGCHIFLLQYDESTLLPPAELSTRVIHGAAALSAKRLILSGASARRNGTLDRPALQRKCDELNRVGRLCTGKGIVLAYHNHDKEFVDGGSEMESMLRDTDPQSVRLLLDAGHAFRAGADIAAFVKQHARRIEGIHLRDFRGGEQVPLGEGDVDLRPLAKLLRETNWRGWLINEEERLNDIKPGDAAIHPARKSLRTIFGV